MPPLSRSQRIKKWYSSIDQYGVTPSLSVKGEDHHKSVCGSTTSIFILLAGLGMLYISSRDYFFKLNPDISSSTKVNKVILDKRIGPGKDFNLAIGVYNESFGVIPNVSSVIRGVSLQINWSASNPGQQRTQLEALPCTAETAPTPEQIGNAFCMPNNEANKNAVAGSEEEKFIYLKLEKCINNAEFNECLDSTTVDALTKNLRVMVFYNDLSVDLSNYDNPVVETPAALKFNSGSDLTRVLRVTLESVTVETDNGLFFPHNTQKSYTRIGSTSIDIDPEKGGELIKIMFLNGNKEIQYSRSYKKYDLISAEVSGVMGVLGILLKLFIVPYFDNSYYAELVKKTFDISFHKNEKKKVDFVELIKQKREKEESKQLKEVQEQQQEEQLAQNFQSNVAYKNGIVFNPPVSSFNQVEEFDENFNIDSEQLTVNPVQYNNGAKSSLTGGASCIKNKRMKYRQSQPIFERKQEGQQESNSKKISQQPKLKMNFFEYATCLFLCRRVSRQRKKILDVGIAKIRKELDIVTILQKLKEIDRLKYCILTHEQLTLFNNLPKQKINFESTEDDEDPLKMMYRKLFVELSDEAKQEYIEKTYNRLKDKQNKSELDQNIVSSFEKALKL